MRFLFPILVVAGLVVSGCTGTVGGSGASPSGPTPSSPAPATLDGRTFLSTAVQGHDLVPGSTVRLTFEGDRIGISAGCNQMGGTFTLASGRLELGQLMATEMGCEPALMAQDTWVATFIDGAAATIAGETLTLANGGTTMTLVDRVVADPDRPLEATEWTLDGVVTGDAVSGVPTGVTAGLTIADGQMKVDTGCNVGSASVAITPTTLTPGPLTLTKKACAPDATSVQEAMTTVLSGEVRYAIEADVLTLTTGSAGLMLRAAR